MTLAGLKEWGGNMFALYVLVTAAIGAATFVFGRQIGYTQRNAEINTERLKAAEEHVQYMDLEYKQLQVQYEQERRDNRSTERYTPGAWDPGQMADRR